MTDLKVRCVLPDDADLAAIHGLVCEAFAYMDGAIDPPSSINRFDLAKLRQHAAQSELIVLGHPPVAAMTMHSRGNQLYLGKIAVAQDMRGQGLARRLITYAAKDARNRGLSALTLQSRVELSDNHSVFRALGFVETGRTSHPGFQNPTSITFTKPV